MINEIYDTNIGFLRRPSINGGFEICLVNRANESFNGVVGRVGLNETLVQGLARKVQEVLNVEIIDSIQKAEIIFHFEDGIGNEYKSRCHIYLIDTWDGEIYTTGQLEWHSLDNMPWKYMWPSTRIWLEPILQRDGFLAAEYKFNDFELVPINKIEYWLEDESKEMQVN